MRKSSPATCVNCGLPAQSPIAQTSGAVVSNRSLTRIYPRASNSTPLSSSPIHCVFGMRPAATQNVAAIKLLLAGLRAYRDPHLLSRSPVNVEDLGRQQNLDAFIAEDPLHLIRNIGILSAHQPRPRLDDGHTAAEATISLRHFEPDISAPEDDQMCGQIIELERLNVGERLAGLETGIGGVVGAGPKLRKTRSPDRRRVPPSLSCTSSVRGATRRPVPMINSAPVAL